MFEIGKVVPQEEMDNALGWANFFLCSLYAVRFPYLVNATITFSEEDVDKTGLVLETETDIPNWETEFTDPELSSNEIAHRLQACYKNLGRIFVQKFVVDGQDIRDFLTLSADLTNFAGDHIYEYPNTLDLIIPDAETLTSLQLQGPDGPNRKLEGFVRRQFYERKNRTAA